MSYTSGVSGVGHRLCRRRTFATAQAWVQAVSVMVAMRIRALESHLEQSKQRSSHNWCGNGWVVVKAKWWRGVGNGHVGDGPCQDAGGHLQAHMFRTGGMEWDAMLLQHKTHLALEYFIHPELTIHHMTALPRLKFCLRPRP